MRAPVLSNSARSLVRIVTSSGVGPEAKEKPPPLRALRCSVSAPSIGIRPRYSMRRATSACDGALIEPVTTSPVCVSAR